MGFLFWRVQNAFDKKLCWWTIQSITKWLINITWNLYWEKYNGRMYKVIQNENLTVKTWTESCCTQKWEYSNLSVLRIKMVVCQGCTQNICTFLCLIVHKQVVTIWNDVSPNGLALLLFECRFTKSICPFTTSSVFFSALWWVRLPYRFSSILCRVLWSFSTTMSLAGGIFLFFFKLLSSDFEKRDFNLLCSLEN